MFIYIYIICVCICVCVRVCVRACVRACVCVYTTYRPYLRSVMPSDRISQTTRLKLTSFLEFTKASESQLSEAIGRDGR